MMKVFIDTSAFYALACESDQFHSQAKAILEKLLQEEYALVTSNYILIETCNLILYRLGVSALRTFLEVSTKAIFLQWISQQIHEKGIGKWLGVGKKDLSLVDCTSFLVMKLEGIKEVFAFDSDFEKEGFRIVR